MAKKYTQQDNEAMSIIHRAAILLKKDGKVPSTPGCYYQIEYTGGKIIVTVTFPEGTNPCEALDKRPYYGEFWDDEIYDHMVVAMARVIDDIGKIDLAEKSLS